MNIFEALILGVVQGLTEFLPISSSGHLVLVPEFLGISAPPLSFSVLVHLATLVAVAGYFVWDLKNMVLSVVAPRRLRDQQAVKYWRRLLLWLVIGSVPAALAGLLLGDFFERLFASTLAVGLFLILTSLLLLGADLAVSRRKRPPRELGYMRPLDALIVGCFQALAIAPGLSRSGATIAGGTFLGFDRPTAARFSFLLSIPAILGAFAMELKDIGGKFVTGSGWAYGLGAVAAAVSGFVAIHFLLRYLRERSLRIFGIYTAALGLLVVVLSLI
ncbi:MAG: undecaprenyl-diphosphatase UppP [Thermoleophilia bacterium]|nr:undecaprenyl-diphosphatase UppP [Thermoleophilia bacterium]